ncbi:hypothetical protein N7462_010070 [Penicillium macrosclerotiorum]|uniref:uncharacterized protein n=1 Tax=Penicillium macrosclerotiorum TaxID=303699 RepID=UPI0025483ABC|nr:uncharacterized protein N7462_010070 [Penicillium macrosclerotiorum]KAJ5669000.1 hypothetical protein N7462_010070 [Penicillium macrosclerotiorum]
MPPWRVAVVKAFKFAAHQMAYRPEELHNNPREKNYPAAFDQHEESAMITFGNSIAQSDVESISNVTPMKRLES